MEGSSLSAAATGVPLSPEEQFSEHPPFSPSRWWRIADLYCFAVWLAVVAGIEARHEPWADESQAWLLARDLNLKTLWFKELRYEGTPGLWHTILWVAQHWFHAPYSALGIVGYLCSALGVVFILWKSPFPRPLTYLLLFSYFIAYQYAVVARSYNLLLLFVFVAAYLYGKRERPLAMMLVLMMMANTSVHGMLLAASLGVCYLIEAYRERSQMSVSVRRGYLAAVIIFITDFAFLIFVLRPTPDVSEFAVHNPATASNSHWVGQLSEIVCFAFFDNAVASALFLLVAAVWCLQRRKFLSFVLPVSLLLAFYVFVHGRPHHHGLAFLAAIAGIWIAYPTPEERSAFTNRARLLTLGMVCLLACLFSLNVWDAAVAMRKDYLYPYSGSEDAASFVKKVGADKARTFGYKYGISAVQAYFDHNILQNIPTTYYHEGVPLYGGQLDLNEIGRERPDYLILFSNSSATDFSIFDPPLRQAGYRLVHFSDGHIFYKRTFFDTASYFIYRHEITGVAQNQGVRPNSAPE